MQWKDIAVASRWFVLTRTDTAERASGRGLKKSCARPASRRASALVSHVTSCRLLFVVPLFVLLAPWSAGGGDREDVALSYVYAYSGCVAARWLCVL